MPRTESLGSYLDALASASPTPGGGAAAAWTLAQGAALLCMVCRLTEGRAETPQRESEVQEALADASAAQRAAERLADADTEAYQAYRAAVALPKIGPGEAALRAKALEQALANAARVPLLAHALASHLLQPLGTIRVLAKIGNPRVASDVEVARCLALAALDASAVNTRVNLALFKDLELARSLELELCDSQSKADAGGDARPESPRGAAWVAALMERLPCGWAPPAA